MLDPGLFKKILPGESQVRRSESASRRDILVVIEFVVFRL
jgi:hypothetical protein